MIIEIIKQAQIRNNFYLFLTLILIYSCENKNICKVKDNNTLQVFVAKKEIIILNKVNSGAYSSEYVDLLVCDRKSKCLIENIGLRGGDYIPRIDSVDNHIIYLHYNYPRFKYSINILKLTDVALGDALLSPNLLKYQYVIGNVSKQ